jgi:DNA-binding transcriptional ArsR family regulator
MKNFSNEAYYLFFSTLASRTRLAIIEILRCGNKSISDLSEALHLEPKVIVDNLEKLKKCVIVRSEGNGKEMAFSLNKEIVEPLFEVLSFHADKYCPKLTECIPEDKLKAYIKQEAAKDLFIEHE